MLNLDSFLKLDKKSKLQIIFAVLLDEKNASQYLANDSEYGEKLSEYAEILVRADLEIRTALLASILRKELTITVE